MPKVSVIVPIYNAGDKLHKCIRSILNQTMNDLELILVNDGSIDRSLSICQQYQKKDNRIIIINKNNEGSIATRRRGVKESVSKYVMFVDADDWIYNKTIEILYQESFQNDLDITVCNMYKVLGKGLIVKRKIESWFFNANKVYDEQEIKNDLLTAYFHGHPFPSSLCAKLYKKDLLIDSGKYLERIRFLGDDLFLNLEILLKVNKLKVIDKPLYYYRQGGFTSRYQPYLYDDMVNGYLIQKEVIDEYYVDSKEKHYNGISIMLLNTFETCLSNLIISNHNIYEIKDLIKSYVSNETLVTCTSNEGAMKFFQTEYLNAIKYKNVDYLYDLGKIKHLKAKPKKAIMNFLSKIF